MPKSHILMITPYLPYPPNSGGRSRTYNLIKHLRIDYDITLICFGRPEEQAFDLSPLRALCDVIVVDRAPSPGTIRAAWLSFTSPKPITMRLYHTPEMRETIARALRERPIDLIHVESFYMMPNLPTQLEVPVLLSEPAIEYVAWQRHAEVATPRYTRPGIILEAYKMRLWEPRVWGEATVVGVMSDVDASIIRQATPGVVTVPAPNGVDIDFFQPDPKVKRDNRTAIYMGDYKYFPNTDAVLYFAQEILPLVHRKRPEFQLVLLGKEAPRELRALHNDPDQGVTLAGFVEDTRPFLHSSAVFVCPLRSGSGTRFKLMEALACGCPVVSTTIGAEGLNAQDGTHMLLRDTPESFADALLELIENPELGQHIGEQGRQWVIKQHAWQHSAALLRDSYDKLIGHEDPTIRIKKDVNTLYREHLQQALDEEDAENAAGES